MNALVLVGSGDVNSHSLSLGKTIARKLEEKNVETEVLNLVEYGLPMYDRTIEREQSYDNKTSEFLKKSVGADIIVWVTPIYHNSFSGILKNALDWQHKTKFDGKVIGLASNGGGRSPQAVDQLMLVARSQGYLSATTRVCTDENVDYNSNMGITSENIQSRIERMTTELVTLAKKLK